jgi:hypothetical protein
MGDSVIFKPKKWGEGVGEITTLNHQNNLVFTGINLTTAELSTYTHKTEANRLLHKMYVRCH